MMGYAGSEEFIRLQFEEYLLALLSAAKYRMYLHSHKDDENAILIDFGPYLILLSTVVIHDNTDLERIKRVIRQMSLALSGLMLG